MLFRSKGGGLAFPVLFVNGSFGDLDMLDFEKIGLTVRDYFAGQYLAGVCANPKMMSLKTALETALNEQDKTIWEIIVGLSYGAADAMLAAREKGSNQ